MPGAVVSISHGGGPMPLMGDPGHAAMVKTLVNKVPKILGLGTSNAPRAIVLVTAHWSEPRPSISSASKHQLYYDYGGFPPETYKLKYDAPGSPEVAQEVYDALDKAGLKPRMDSKRGWDHGVFVPMTLINPSANIPIVQLSVLSSDSPAQHYAMGKALASLRDSGVAIIGSGMPTFHNMRILHSLGYNKDLAKKLAHFSETVTDTIKVENSEERGQKLESWRNWIGGVESHPHYGVEHFLPLIVCAGAGGDGKAGSLSDDFMGMDHYTYFWN